MKVCLILWMLFTFLLCCTIIGLLIITNPTWSNIGYNLGKKVSTITDIETEEDIITRKQRSDKGQRRKPYLQQA